MYNLNNVYDFDNTIFNGIDVELVNKELDPSENIPPMNQDVLVSSIMMRCALLQPVYGEPPVLRQMIGYWWQGCAWNFAQMWRTMHLSYNPIENYNRFEDSKRRIDRQRDVIDDHQLSGSDKVQTGGSDTQRQGGTDTVRESGTDTQTDGGTDTTRNSGSDTVEHQVSAYNESFYQPKDKDTTTFGKNTDVDYGKSSTTDYGKHTDTDYGQTNTTEYGGNSTTTYGKGDTETIDEKEQNTDEFHEHVHGNIGVTTTQQMIEQELNIRRKSVYDMIANDFEDRFCITIYSNW